VPVLNVPVPVDPDPVSGDPLVPFESRQEPIPGPPAASRQEKLVATGCPIG
jgi:hypothetical protein